MCLQFQKEYYQSAMSLENNTFTLLRYKAVPEKVDRCVEVDSLVGAYKIDEWSINREQMSSSRTVEKEKNTLFFDFFFRRNDVRK